MEGQAGMTRFRGWVGEDVGLFRIWEGCGALLDELLLLEFLVVKTGIVYRRVG